MRHERRGVCLHQSRNLTWILLSMLQICIVCHLGAEENHDSDDRIVVLSYISESYKCIAAISISKHRLVYLAQSGAQGTEVLCGQEHIRDKIVVARNVNGKIYLKVLRSAAGSGVLLLSGQRSLATSDIPMGHWPDDKVQGGAFSAFLIEKTHVLPSTVEEMANWNAELVGAIVDASGHESSKPVEIIDLDLP